MVRTLDGLIIFVVYDILLFTFRFMLMDLEVKEDQSSFQLPVFQNLDASRSAF